MQIETISIRQLKPAPYNPRVNLKPGDAAYERLERSIDEFDLVEPLVWNRRSGNLVAGHQRLKILKSRGLTEVPVSVVDLAPEQEKALNVALNNSNLSGDWDLNKLNEILAEFDALADFDASLTGFDAAEIRSLLFEPPADAADAEANEVTSNRVIEVEVIMPADRWDVVKPDLDALLARYNLVCHVNRS